MAITTNAELNTAVSNWLDRSDLTLRIPEFIVLFEAKVNRKLRVRQQITSTTLTPSSGSVALPTDYLEWKRVTWSGTPKRELEFVDGSYLQQAYPDNPSDTPRVFTIEGSTLRIAPIDATGLTFVYAQKVPPLTTTDPNWFLTAHPDGYLEGTLAVAGTFTCGDDERLKKKAECDATVDSVVEELRKLTFSQSGPAMVRAYGSTP